MDQQFDLRLYVAVMAVLYSIMIMYVLKTVPIKRAV